MRFTTSALAFAVASALAASVAAQTTPARPAITRTVIVATKLPTVTDVPLYFRVGGCHPCAGRVKQRLGGQRHPLSDLGIDQSLHRRRNQNAQHRRGVLHS